MFKKRTKKGHKEKTTFNQAQQPKKTSTSTFKIMYSNCNGIGNKIECFNNIVYAEDVQVAVLVETKTMGCDPLTNGYKWFARKAKGQGSGGLAFVVKEEIASKVSTIDYMHESDLETLWIKINNGNGKPLAIGAFYGLQENAQVEELDRQFNMLRTQLPQIMIKHTVILVGDFNAKLHVERGVIHQAQSRNGERLKELMTTTNLDAVSLMSEKGMWAREEERSIIDYVLADESAQKYIKELTIDEEGEHRLKNSHRQGKKGKICKESDHNTFMIELDLKIQTKCEKIKVWKRGTEENWKQFNIEIQNNDKEKRIESYDELRKIISQTLHKTIGKKTVVKNGKKRESENVKVVKCEKATM